MNAPGSQVESLHRALALISSGEPDAALALLNTMSFDRGLHPHALHLRGIAHATQGRTTEAIQMFEDALPWLADNEE